MFLLTGLAFIWTGFGDFSFWSLFCLLRKSNSFVLSDLAPPSPSDVEQSLQLIFGCKSVPLNLNRWIGSDLADMVRYDMDHSNIQRNFWNIWNLDFKISKLFKDFSALVNLRNLSCRNWRLNNFVCLQFWFQRLRDNINNSLRWVSSTNHNLQTSPMFTFFSWYIVLFRLTLIAKRRKWHKNLTKICQYLHHPVLQLIPILVIFLAKKFCSN